MGSTGDFTIGTRTIFLLESFVYLTLFGVALVLGSWYAGRLLRNWGTMLVWLGTTIGYVAVSIKHVSNAIAAGTRPTGPEDLPYTFIAAVLISIIAFGPAAWYTLHWQQTGRYRLGPTLVARGVLVVYLGVLAFFLWAMFIELLTRP